MCTLKAVLFFTDIHNFLEPIEQQINTISQSLEKNYYCTTYSSKLLSKNVESWRKEYSQFSPLLLFFYVYILHSPSKHWKISIQKWTKKKIALISGNIIMIRMKGNHNHISWISWLIIPTLSWIYIKLTY